MQTVATFQFVARLQPAFFGAVCMLMAIVTAGCENEPAVRVYDAPKSDTEFVSGPLAGMSNTASSSSSGGAASSATATRRILGAIIPMDESCYFLKATEEPERLEPLMEPFHQIVSEFEVDNGTGLPKLTLPEGWTMRPRNDVAKAEFVVKVESGEVKFTVTELGMPQGGGWDDYLLSNVNRWRGQLKLSELTADSIEKELVLVSRPGAKLPSYIFDAVGTGSGAMSGGRPPFAGAAGTNANPSARPAAANPSANAANAEPSGSSSSRASQNDAKKQPELVYELPKGWKSGESMPFRLATFSIQTDQGEGEATVSMAVDNPEANTMMWFQQLSRDVQESQLKSLAEAAIAKAEAISGGKTDAVLYTIRESEQEDAPVMFVATMPSGQDGLHLFVKLRGEPKLVLSEKENLTQFVKSLTWK